MLCRAKEEQMCCTLRPVKMSGMEAGEDEVGSVLQTSWEKRMVAASLPSGYQGTEHRVREAPACFMDCLEFSALVQHL